MSFVRGANPIWLMVDLDGNILDDTYYISYLTNTLPYLPQVVYRDNQGLVPWTDPIEFLANGTLPDNIYFNEDLVYRLEVRHGNTQNDALIYEVNDYVPGNGGAPDTQNTGAQENQISNPQFSQVNFGIIPGAASTPSLVLTVAGTYEIAPDWFLELTGSGSATIVQKIYTGTQNISSSNQVPPYSLVFTTSGWTSAILYQRFNGNGDIWQNQFVSMSLLARSTNSIANNITLIYRPNTPGNPVSITTAPLNVGVFSIIQGIKPLTGPSGNSVLNNLAYVDMQIVLPPTGGVELSNIQVMGQAEQLPIDFAVLPEETIERQIDHLFNYYGPLLIYKQVPSFLIGWDFPLNPTQFGSSMTPQATGANKSYYIWDQTILFQSATSAFNINRSNNLGGLIIEEAAPSQAAIIQYLDAEQAEKILSQEVSVNLLANCQNHNINVTVSLWYTKDVSLPNIVATTSLVATLDANGKPATFNGNWIEVPRENLQNAYATITVNADSSFIDYPFSGWNLNNLTEARLATFFAIVIGTSAMAANDALDFQSISLIPGNLPCRPAPQSFDEVFRQCQYFYEKSYLSSVVVGSVTNEGARTVSLSTSADSSGSVYNMYAQTFGLVFGQTKRVIPNVQFWTPAGLVNNIFVGMISGNTYLTPDATLKINPNTDAISGYTAGYQSPDSFIFTPTALRLLFTFAAASFTNTTFTLQSIIIFHYSADARLGVV